MPGSSSGRHEHDAVAEAAGVLARGGVVVYPTETLYALGADAFNGAGLQRLVELKVRQAGKPIAVLVSDFDMVADIAAEIPPQARALMRRFWPGPLTLVLRARPHLSSLLTGDETGIGLRLSSHPLATALVRALGHPVTAPSANPAGMQPPTTVEHARAYFGSQVDRYLDGGSVRGEPASTVVDVRDGLTVIREGAVPVDELLTASSPEQSNPDPSPRKLLCAASASGAR
jgi:L-threonylcarbamoyladenylate synthase